MFTIKLYRQGGLQETVISALWYEIFGDNGRYTIVTHQDMPCSNGVGFEISNIDDEKATSHFNCCYIENQKGKTIAAYKAKGFKEL
jgi:hypothetical protein